ncbi:MAG: hypothetical protein LAT62_02055 [Natronospirillum sp.]|uniref:hypothetical protein n=1 Tax=Natronospirillum sp. TaxID=2812955 RepID=UPI0025EF1496|nr:hypothetical protein [Natronospirillum sp.]MCH8550689.1 hypothetical protein [Natronospirillum sp.]
MMNDQQRQLKEELEAIGHGLFMISPDCIRALSTHEEEELIEQLRARVEKAIKLLDKAG